MVSSVGLADCDVVAMIGHRSVMATALPRKRNFLHTCWVNFFPFASNGGTVEACAAYYFLVLYWIGTLGYGAC